jgi:hypothetical protein
MPQPAASNPGTPLSAIGGISGADGRRCAERAHLAFPDLRQRGNRIGKQKRHVPGNHIGQRRRAAFVGNVRHFDAGHAFEQLGIEMMGGAGPA